jgi:hypothetical protein
MEANNTDLLLNAYVLLGATRANQEKPDATKPAAAAEAADATKTTSYTLAGHENELAKLNGHRVEIAGTLVPKVSAGRMGKAAGADDGTQRIAVTSVKALPGSCSPAPRKQGAK